MAVSVPCKPGKLLSRIARGSLLGDSLLVRARTISFAVLGASAAVGLAVLAIALQEDWPLVPGSPPPRPVGQGSVGEGKAVSAPKPSSVPGGPATARGRAAGAPRNGRSSHAGAGGGTGSPAGSAPDATTELVVSPSVPVAPSGDAGAHGPRQPHSPSPSQPQQPKPPAPPAAPASSPATAAPAPPTPAATPPAAGATASSSPPTQSYVPSWSNGQGHAYGREGDGGAGSGHRYDD